MAAKHAARSTQHAACSTQHAARSTQHAALVVSLAIWCSSLGVSGCSDVDHGFDSEATSTDDDLDQIGTSRQALTTVEFTAIQDPNANLAESAASVFQTNTTGIWEMITSQGNDFGCTRDGYATWCNQIPANQTGGDPTLVYRAGPTRFLYKAGIWGTGIRVERTTEPCPVSCATQPTWSQCDITGFVNNEPDYPTLLWKSDQVWTVVDDAGLLTVVRLNEPWTTSNCNKSRWTFNAGSASFSPRAAFDSSGRIHIVYDDQSVHKIRPLFPRHSDRQDGEPEYDHGHVQHGRRLDSLS